VHLAVLQLQMGMWLDTISKNAVVAYYKQICATVSLNIKTSNIFRILTPHIPFLPFLYPYLTIISFPPLSLYSEESCHFVPHIALLRTHSCHLCKHVKTISPSKRFRSASQPVDQTRTTDAAGCFFFHCYYCCYEWNVYLSRFWYCNSLYHHASSQLTDPKNGSCEILLRIRHRCTHFQRTLVPPQNSSRHLGDMNQFPYWGVTVQISSRPADVATPLVQERVLIL
jgi:hypothetical protein